MGKGALSLLWKENVCFQVQSGNSTSKEIIRRISEEHFSYGISSLVQAANIIFGQEKFAYEVRKNQCSLQPNV